MSDLTSWLTQTVEIAGRACPAWHVAKNQLRSGQSGARDYWHIATFPPDAYTLWPDNKRHIARNSPEIVTAMCGVVATSTELRRYEPMDDDAPELVAARAAYDAALAELRRVVGEGA